MLHPFCPILSSTDPGPNWADLRFGTGAKLEVLAAGEHGAILLLEWKKFRALLPIRLDFDNLEGLQGDRRLVSANALLFADSSYACSNPPE